MIDLFSLQKDVVYFSIIDIEGDREKDQAASNCLWWNEEGDWTESEWGQEPPWRPRDQSKTAGPRQQGVWGADREDGEVEGMHSFIPCFNTHNGLCIDTINQGQIHSDCLQYIKFGFQK